MLIEIRLLGRFSARRGGEEIPPSAFRQRLTRSLVQMLLTRRGEFVSRDALTGALWPRRPPADPAANLRVLVNLARRAFGDPTLLLTGPGGYSFARAEACVVDAEVLLNRVEGGRRELAAGQASAALTEFQAALDLWAGEPLTENAHEDWAQEYRSRLGRAYGQALEGAAAAALALRDPEVALALAELAAGRDPGQDPGRDPLRESGQLVLVRALANAGDAAGLDAFRRRLMEELGLDLSPEAAALQARLLRGEPLRPAARPQATVARGLAVFQELSFVGRQRELETMRPVFSGASAAAVVVSGAAGVGKSRLLSEAATRSALPVIAARAFLPEREDAWALARSLLREALALDCDAAKALPDGPAEALAELLPELEDVRPLRESSLDSESRRALALEGSALLMWALGAGGALVIVDDLQWADGSSLALLGLIIRRAPIQVVLAYRPEEVAARGTVAGFLRELPGLGRPVTIIELEPLRPQAIFELVPDEKLARVISEDTDRTPHAVSEVIRALAREGSIQCDLKGRWRARRSDAAERAREAAMAGQAHAVQTRVARLPPRPRRLLMLLALLGREAPARLLARASDASQAEVLAGLDVLSRAGLVRLGGKGWAVAHDLIGEALRETMTRPDQGQIHEVLATALAAEDEDASEIARHHEGAGDSEAAARAFARAGRLRLDRFAGDEAERLAERGLSLHPKPKTRAELLEIRGEVRALRGNLAGARNDLRAAIALMPSGATRAHLFARLAMLTSGLDDYLRAGGLVELALAEAASDAGARAEALAIGAIIDANTGCLDRAEARSGEALSLFKQIGDAQGVAAVLDGRATCMLVQGRLREAVEMLSRVGGLFQDSGQLLRLGTTLGMRAFSLVLTGRANEALTQAEGAVELARMLGCDEGEGFALAMRGFALATLGRPEEATQQLEDTLALARQFGHREYTLATLLFLGIAQEATGRLHEAEANLREALHLAERVPLFYPWVSARLACVLIAQGALGAAEPLVAQPLPGTVMDFEARLARAELAVARGDPDASETVAEALALAEEAGHVFSATRLRELLRLAH